MPGKLLFPLAFGETAAHTGGQGRALDQPCGLLILEPFGTDRFTLTSNTAEKGAMGNAGKLQPGLKCDNRAGGVGRAATNFDFAPAGLAPQRNQHAHVWKKFNPAATDVGLITRNTRPRSRGLGRDVEADDLWVLRLRIKRRDAGSKSKTPFSQRHRRVGCLPNLLPRHSRAHGRLNPRAC